MSASIFLYKSKSLVRQLDAWFYEETHMRAYIHIHLINLNSLWAKNMKAKEINKAYLRAKALANPYSQDVIDRHPDSCLDIGSMVYASYHQIRKCKDDMRNAGFIDEFDHLNYELINRCIKSINNYVEATR